MKRFVEGEDRNQSTLFPERLEDYIGTDNPVRVVDVFIEELNLGDLGFERVNPRAIGGPVCKIGSLLLLPLPSGHENKQGARRFQLTRHHQQRTGFAR